MSLKSEIREVKDAIDLAERVADTGKCDDFAESCKEKFESFLARLEEEERPLTPGQVAALDNMVEGLQKWVR